MMSPTEARQLFLQSLSTKIPSVHRSELERLISPTMICPFEIEISESVLSQAKKFASSIFKLREATSYQKYFAANAVDTGNKSVMICYDFHLTEDGNLKLIEANTNAAFLGLGLVLNESRGIQNPISNFSYDSLFKMFETDFRLFQDKIKLTKTSTTNRSAKNPDAKIRRLAIVDDHPPQQRMYSEFLFFKSFFEARNIEVDVLDLAELDPLKYDLIYNRLADFHLMNPESAKLRQAYVNMDVCVSPNPLDYALLADKHRMIDWMTADLKQFGLSDEDALNIQSKIPGAKAFFENDLEEIWANRKNLFFKPTRSYGSKQTYRGAKISRKTFDEIKNADFIAQDYIPASEIQIQLEGTLMKLKYDLRFYVYQDKVQHVLARVYQGQVTNLQTPFGGFAPIKIKT